MSFNFNSTTGTSGVTNITVSASERQEFTDLVELYNLSNENGYTKSVPIVQKGQVPIEKYISMTPSGLTFPSSGGSMTIQINTNDNFELDIPSWLTIPITGGTSGNTIVPIYLPENTGITKSGTITGYCASDHSVSATTTVTENGGYINPYINLGYYSITATSESAATSVTVTSNISWITMTDSRWIDVNTLSGSGNGNVSFTIDPNPSDFNREGIITILNYDYDVYAELVVRQSSAVKPYIEFYPTVFVVDASGSTGNSISVSANCDYDITADVDWITLDATSGTGYGSVSFSTDPNEGASDTGNIEFSNSSVTRSVIVQRNEAVKYLSASTSSLDVNYDSHDVEISIYSNVDWNVLVQEENENPSGWISVVPSSGNGNGTLRVSISSATTFKSAIIFLYNSTYGLSWEIEVRQEQGDTITYRGRPKAIFNQNAHAYDKNGNELNLVSHTYDSGTGIGIIVYDGNIVDYGCTSRYDSGTVNCSVPIVPPTELYSWSFPNTVETIGPRCFGGLYPTGQTVEYILGNNVKIIGEYAFQCMGNEHLDFLPSTVTGITYEAFAGSLMSDIIWPESLKRLGYGAFMSCYNLKEANLPDSLTTIGAHAFSYCPSLTSTTIGTGVTGMSKDYSYMNCYNLKNVTYKGSGNMFGVGIFSGCSSLQNIYMYVDSLPIIASNTFAGTPSTVTVHIKSGVSISRWLNDPYARRWTYVADL